ncbi:MAG TPA: hypothetical protein VG796_14120 [Verrucomicrobiales bacterium]|jgi:hypothetical protein|nr:hypothetical protein [Verrucomicrobiales bacterium]
MRAIAFILCACLFAGAAVADELPLRQRVSQYGISWTFDRPARVGQFVNGDFYAVGPVNIIDIDPKPQWGAEVGELIDRDEVRESKFPGKQARNGSELNPQGKSQTGGFDSRIPAGWYDPGRFARLPIQMKPGDALVSTISRRNGEITKFSGQHVDPLRVAAVLSCVAQALPPDSFRPSYCDAAGSGNFRAGNLRRDLLLRLPHTSSAPKTLTSYITALQKPWLDTVVFGFAAPVENLPHYGQFMAQTAGEASLLLLTDYPKEEKERLLINLVQAGIDLWGVARTGGTWPAHGGLNSGRKWPIIFAGMMLGDAKMHSPSQGRPELHFGEDDQTAFCPYEYRDKTYISGWTGARAIFTGHSLAGSGGNRGNWESGWGPLDLFRPADWPNKNPRDLPASEAYRRANTSSAWVAQALAARLLHAEPVWNHDAFFAYVDRWMTEDDTPFVRRIKEAGFRDLTAVPVHEFPRQGSISGPKFVRELWNAHRNKIPRPAPPPAESTWK